ncbi:MAG: hypothetical protein Q4D58_04805 [Synergistaceae bacterium]|nr:hypothetical protein [Synergistaceae bacterium]
MSKKKFLTQLLALVTALTMSFAGTAFAMDVWDGTVGTVPAASNNVITITTGAQLAGLAASVNGGTDYAAYTVRLGDDINLNNLSWTPIGRFFNYGNASNRAFCGTFDGAGYTIRGLNVVNNQANWSTRGETAGLFGYIDFPTAAASGRSAAKTATVTPAAQAAADAAALGLTGDEADKVIAERTAFYNAFGIEPAAPATRTTAAATGGIVKNLKVMGVVSNTYGQGAAGIVCWNDGAVENCYFEGTVSNNQTRTRSYVGGISALLGASTRIVNCVVSGDIAAYGTLSYGGGIAGYCFNMSTGYIVNCSVQPGSSIYSNMDTGGIVGGFAYRVYNCVSAAATVNVSDTVAAENNDKRNYTGGIIGAYGAVYNCYWLYGGELQPNYAIGGGTNSNGRVTSINSLPIASVLLPGLSFAAGSSGTLTAVTYPTNAAGNTPIYSWSATAGLTVSNVTTGTTTVSASSAGSGTVTATVTDSTKWTTLTSPHTVTAESFVTVTN